MNTKTKFIGIKEFRQHMAEYAKTAREQKQHIIVMSHNRPLFAVTPLVEDNDLSSLVADIVTARADVLAGRTYTQEAMLAELS